jgi:tetratricopeptide (TPR) repeat protein
MAQLLETKIERHRKDFYPNGWQIVRRMQACRDALNEHRPFFLEASLEAVKSCVYLRHGNVPPPGDDPAFPTLEQSLTTVDAIIDEARTLHLTAIVLQALLVKARTLLRLNDLNKATMIAKEARNLANLPRFRKHHAEALFVEGKISSKRVSKAISEDDPAAYRHLSKAITLFDSALEKEHPSRMFQIACRLQIADARIRLGHCARAQRYLLEAKKLAKNVESPFLHE